MKLSFSSLHAPAWGVVLALSSACGGSTTRESTSTGGSAGQGGSAAAGGTVGRGGVSGVGAEGGVSGVGAEGGVSGAGAFGGAVGAGAFGGAVGAGAFGGVSGVGAEGGVAGVGAQGGVAGSGGLSCVRTQDGAQIEVTPAGQARVDCQSVGWTTGPVSPTVLEGSIVRNLTDGFDIDTCAPNADCAASITHFLVRAPGLSFLLPEGAFVRVTYSISRFYSCQKALEVSTIPTWGGVQNPYQPSNALLLAVSDGGGTFGSSPYKIDRVALGCRPTTPGCGSVKPDEYALVFTPTAVPERALRVGMGETRRMDLGVADLPYSWLVRNLRSFQTEYCDDYWNFAWFVQFDRPTL